MDMNKVFFLRREDSVPKWHLLDAQGQILGRLSTKIADLLTGKGKTDFAPHTDNGDYVVVINAKHVVLTGNKFEDKIYTTVSGYIGGKKELTAKQVMAKDPTRILHHSVKGMLPKNKLAADMLRRLRVYPASDHPHEGQI